MVNTRRKLHILIGAHIIKQLKAGCPGCEIQGKVFFICKIHVHFISHENLKTKLNELKFLFTNKIKLFLKINVLKF